jgi:hypothetical protein
VEVTNTATPTLTIAASGSKITIAWTHMVMQAQLLSRVQVAIGLLFLQDKDLYYIKTTPFLGWFYILQHGKEHQIFGIRAIIEAIKQELQTKFIFKRSE